MIVLFLSCAFNSFADDMESFKVFIDPFINNRIIDVNEGSIANFRTENIKQKLISNLSLQAKSSDEEENKLIMAYIETLEINNYEIQNIIFLDKNEYFINYQIRTNIDEMEKFPDTNAVLGPMKFLYFITCTFNSEKLTVSNVDYFVSAYSELNFNKYKYKDKTVLYYINNESSFGMGTSELNLNIINPLDMHEILSENVLYTQIFYSKDYEDIANFTRFKFVNDSIEFTGMRYDENKKEYVNYSRIVKIFQKNN